MSQIIAALSLGAAMVIGLAVIPSGKFSPYITAPLFAACLAAGIFLAEI